ncbi:MAG: 1-(5-phosphoribosyl)-5-[(5-phosphoribosylamino)methylideneamino]imidazole-4-carboxamide isomerase [Pseudobdellovibrionaceae bacterium]
MVIYPAIDLIDGQCVRLTKGDYSAKTVYDGAPADVACAYRDEGASWLHLVDLNGAKDPEQRQTQLIADIIRASNLRVQTGGGVRTLSDIKALLDAGAGRVVVGSMAVKNHDLMAKALGTFGGDRLTLAVDVMRSKEDGFYNVAVSGWQEASRAELMSTIASFMPYGLTHILCTDIDRDGTLTGCNAELYETIKRKFPRLEVQASGGVSDVSDICELAQVGIDGIVVGKALYEGKFTLRQALESLPC